MKKEKMSEEEQEAILHFQKYENKLVYEINEKDKRYAKTLLNYISKLQKENEELKEQVNVFDKAVKCDKCDCNICEAEKIILRLQKELEQEKEKTANIQEQKMQFYNRGVEVTNKWWQDKIKDKIKVFKKEGSQTSIIIAKVLEELLEENK